MLRRQAQVSSRSNAPRGQQRVSRPQGLHMSIGKKVILTLVIVAVFGFARTTPAQRRGPSTNVLSSIAASMPSGSFALLNKEGDSSGYGRGLLLTGGSSSIMGFASKAAYDPVTDRVYFSGGEHNGKTLTIHYEIATNTW